jgi:tetratricopeptide (TPR) repeat protein
VDKGHGRTEIRQLTSTTALNDYLDRPDVGQVFALERVRVLQDKTEVEVVHGISSLGRKRADAAERLRRVRGHWGIENRVQWVRDETLAVDRRARARDDSCASEGHDDPLHGRRVGMMRSKKNLLLWVLALGLGGLGTSPRLPLLGKDPAPPSAVAPSPELKAFLVAEDLDDVGDARAKIKSVSPGDAAAIRAILKQWRNAQAVSNLLMDSDLIPEDMRLAALFRGLAEQRVDYYVVAAVIGLDHIDRDKLSAEDRKRVVATLLGIIRETRDVRAKRASLTVSGFVSATDAPQVMALMVHPDETVRQNLRAWLFNMFKGRGVEPYATAARKSGLPEGARRRLVAEFTEFVKNPRQKEQKSKTHVLFAYIPNLKDFEPQDAVGYYNRGNAYYQNKDYERAIENYNEALRLDPKDFKAYCNRGCAYEAKKDYDRAIQDYSESIRLDPTHAFVYHNRGNAYRARKDYHRAVEDYTDAIRRDPKHAPAYNDLASLLATCPVEKVRDGRKARKYASKACE